MTKNLPLIVAAAISLCLGTVTTASATTLTYTTSGNFLSSNSNIYTDVQGGATLTITFSPGAGTFNVPPSSGAPFGTFSVSITGDPNVPFNLASGNNMSGIGFQLFIDQTLPTLGSVPDLTFDAALGGTIQGNNSGTANVTFLSPLFQTINNGDGTISFYTITQADLSQPGRTNLLSNATANVVGEVNIVPEPGSILLFGSGLLGLSSLVRRRRQLSK